MSDGKIKDDRAGGYFDREALVLREKYPFDNNGDPTDRPLFEPEDMSFGDAHETSRNEGRHFRM